MSISKIFTLLLALIIIFSNCNKSFAHSPHDVIEVLTVSPSFKTDNTLFIVVAWNLMRSEDGGFSWKELCNGLDCSHMPSSISLSPDFGTEGVALLSTLGDGIYKSGDGGDSWEKVNVGLESLDIPLIVIAPDFQKSAVALAADTEGKLYRSKNQGQSWESVFEGSAQITAASFLPCKHGYKALLGDETGVLNILSDKGEKRERLARFEGSGSITSILVSPSFDSDETVWIGTSKGGIFKSVDGGGSFHPVNGGLSDKNITSLEFSVAPQKGSLRLYASTWTEGFYISDDGGQSWHKFVKGLTTDPQADEPHFNAPHFKGVGIGGNRLFFEGGPLFLGGFDGLFRSDDGGRKWYQLETLPLKYICGLSLSPAFEKVGRHAAIISYGAGAYLFDDAEKKWRVINKGLRSPRLTDIIYSSSYGENLVIFSAAEREVLKLVDNEAPWQRIGYKSGLWTRLQEKLNRYFRKLGLSESVRLKIIHIPRSDYKFPSVLATSPDYVNDTTVFFGTRGNGIYRSGDGGKTFKMMWGAKGKLVTALEISPDFASDQTLFASLVRDGIYKTVNGGRSWKLMKEFRLPGWTNIVISPNYKEDRTVFAGTSAGLFRSADGGQIWELLRDPVFRDFEKVLGLAISPCYERDGMLLVSIKGCGLFQTRDRGESFYKVASHLIAENYQLQFIEFSPQFCVDNIVFGASPEELFRSTDRGQNWTLIKRPVRYEDRKDVIVFSGKWTSEECDQYSASSLKRSNRVGDRASLRFVGTGIKWVGEKSPDSGRAKVYIDGACLEELSLRSKERASSVDVFSVSALPRGAHEITVEVVPVHTKENPGWVAIDAFDVAP